MKLPQVLRKKGVSGAVERSLFMLLFLYPVLFIFQGGDLTDAGFFAMNYQNFFKNLQAGETNSISFLADLLGALWFRAFPDSGILGLSLLWLITFYSATGIIYIMLKGLTKDRVLLLTGIFCGIAFGIRFTMFTFDRDLASWFFLLLASFFLIKGLTNHKLLYIYLSGMTFLPACLSRFPNIVFFAIVPFALFYCQYCETPGRFFLQIRKTAKACLFFYSGSLSLFILFYGAMNYYGLWEIFTNNFDIVKTSLALEDRSSHSVFHFLITYKKELKSFIPHLVVVLSVMLLLSLIYEYSVIKKNNKPIFLFSFFLFFLVALYYRDFSCGNPIKYSVPAFCAFPLLVSLIRKDRFSTIAVVACAVTVTQVAGSNTGFFLKLTYGCMVLIPLSFLILSGEKQFLFGTVRIAARPILSAGILFILVVNIYVRIGWIYHVDKGLTCRFRCIYEISHKKMQGLFTTQAQALHIESLSQSIGRHLDEKSKLFIYGHQPMFYYLTEALPAVRKFWLVDNYVQPDELFHSLEEAIQQTGKYPLVVDTGQFLWGENGQERLNGFFKKYGYRCIEEQERFKIWKK